MKQIPGTDLWVPDADEHFFGMKPEQALTYQHDRIDLAVRHLPRRRRRLALDVGAHVGILTRRLAAEFDRVIAFEPTPDNFACLERNTAGLANVELRHAAVGAECGEAGCDTQPRDNSGDRRIALGADRFTRRVPMVSLDSLRLEALDLLKVDVQGFEYYVIEGAQNTLRYCRPVCVVEHERVKEHDQPFPHNSKEALALLKRMGALQVGQISVDHIFAFPDADNIVFDKYAKAGAYHWEKYENSRWTVELVTTIVEHIRSRGHQSILDVGCGDGLFTKLLGEGAYGIDNSEEGIRLAKEHGVACECLSAFEVGRLGRRFDAACLFDTLEHVYEQARLVDLLGTVTDRLYVLNPEPWAEHPDTYHTREFTADDLIAWMAGRGWRLEFRRDYAKTAENRKSFLEFTRVAA